MNSFSRPVRRSPRGFSLLELMLVLVIMAILAGLVVMNIGGISQNAKIQAAKTQLGTFKLCLNRFELDMGHFPSSGEGLQVLVTKPSDGAEDWKGPYLDSNEVPKDQWGNAWVYRQPGQHNPDPDGYDLSSNGPDGREGTEDDIGNWASHAVAKP